MTLLEGERDTERKDPPGSSRVEGRCLVSTLNMMVEVGLLPCTGKEPVK